MHWTSTTILRRCKLGYLRVSSRIFKRNFYESAQINGVEQHSEQSSYVNSDWPSVELLKHFLLVALPYMNDMISISIHEELQNCLHLCIIKSFVSLKVLIQSERTRWFMVWTLCSTFVQGIVRVKYSPYFLLLWTLDNIFIFIMNTASHTVLYC